MIQIKKLNTIPIRKKLISPYSTRSSLMTYHQQLTQAIHQ